MDEERMDIFECHATFMNRINRTYGMNKLRKYNLIIDDHFELLEKALNLYTDGDMTCCEEPRSREMCEINKLVHTLIEVLEISMANVPQSFKEVTVSRYLKFICTLEEMQLKSRSLTAKLPNCSLTSDEMIRWREMCIAVQMLLLSRHGFCRELRWGFKKSYQDTTKDEKKYLGDMWRKLERRRYVLPLVKYEDIQEFEKRYRPYIINVTMDKIDFECSNCEELICRNDDCALLNSCDHLYCIKCAFLMAAMKNVKCTTCQENYVNWTTKSLIQCSTVAYNEANKTNDVLDFIGVAAALSVFYVIGVSLLYTYCHE